MERWAFYTERLRCDGHLLQATAAPNANSQMTVTVAPRRGTLRIPHGEPEMRRPLVTGTGGAARQSTNDGVCGVAMWNAAYSTRRG